MSTYTPIASVTLASAQSSVTFSGIPQTYTDLVLVANGTASGNTGLYAQFNGDTANNYSLTVVEGSGSAAVSERQTSVGYARFVWNSLWNTTTPGVATINIQNYANATTNKTMIWRSSTASNYVEAGVNLWRSTAAITSVTITGSSNNIAAGSTFNLYGVANASITNTAKATGGDIVTTDGTYWYHTFYSSGTFTPTTALTADYLVVAGGGGGSGNPSGGFGGGGGGGAGGLRCTVTATGGGGSLESALSLTASTNYTVTVGGGGAGGSGNANGSAGSNSVFSSITSTGGGFGSTQGSNGSDAGTGGSGGGGGCTRAGGAGTTNQGYAGGTAVSTAGGAAGGGAGAVGGNPVGSPNTWSGGTGGTGVATSITGASVTYAGGGGGGGYNTGYVGGAGGTGGGGAGGADGVDGTAGTANIGGGGGGAGGTQTGTQVAKSGGNGGSGIVIVRYSV